MVRIKFECHTETWDEKLNLAGLRLRIFWPKILFGQHHFSVFAVVNDVLTVHVGPHMLKIGGSIQGHRSPPIWPVTAAVMRAERYSESWLTEVEQREVIASICDIADVV